ncbi:hypothetical protein NQ314_004169 [Rhamnusium bicolor]|uniref:Uncharacterized protein n=1 Tax=Rhamnusium bicolor TaxID=1586634 RepID=A0AAV8ZM56_9CUCU|nr:hypothetical protein NQ314_004169 [Rhamnusium bicolor]
MNAQSVNRKHPLGHINHAFEESTLKRNSANYKSNIDIENKYKPSDTCPHVIYLEHADNTLATGETQTLNEFALTPKRKDVDFEDALNDTANSEGYGIGFIVPAAECELELNSYKKGILTSTNLIGNLTSCALWGYLSDIKGRRNLLIINLITAFLTGLSAALTPSFLGILISGPTAVTFVYFGEFLSTNTKEKSMGWATTFVALAMIYLPSLGWFLLQQTYDIEFLGLRLNNWRIFMLVNSTPSAIAAMGLMTLPESPKYLYHTGNHKEALAVLKKMYSHNTGNSEDAFPVESLNTKIFLEKFSKGKKTVWRYLSDQIFPLVKPPLLLYTLSACFMQAGAFAVGSGLFTWYPDIITQISKSGKTGVTICEALSFNSTVQEDTATCNNVVNDRVFILNIIIGVYYLVAYSTWFVLIKALRTRNFFITCMGISAIGTAVLCYLSDRILIDIIFITTLVLPGISITIINVWVVEIFPTHICGMALCTVLTVGRLGSVVSSSVVGIMLEWSCITTFMLYALSLIGN